MLFGFAINRGNGSSDFGVANGDDEATVRRDVAEEAEVDLDSVVMMDAGEALSQFRGIALLAPLEA